MNGRFSPGPPPGRGPMHRPPPGPMPPYPMDPRGMPPPQRPQSARRKDTNSPLRKGRCLVKAERDEQTSAPKASKGYTPAPNRARRKGTHWITRGYVVLTAVGICIAVLVILAIPYIKTASLRIMNLEDKNPNAWENESDFAAYEPKANAIGESVADIRNAALQNLDGRTVHSEQLLKENNSVTRMGDVSSYSFTGTLKIDGKIHHMKLFVRAPDQARQVLRFGPSKSTAVINGASGKCELVEISQEDTNIRDLSSEESIMILATSIQPLALWQSNVSADLINNAGAERVGHEKLIILRNLAYPSIDLLHYFSPSTALETKRVIHFQHEGEPATITAEFSDYQKAGDYVIPTTVVATKSYSPTSQTVMTIQDWSFNPGLLPSLFALEDTLSPMLAEEKN